MAKGKFWELRKMTTKPPGVTLVDMVMYKELSEKKRGKKTHTSEAQKRRSPRKIDRKPTLTKCRG